MKGKIKDRINELAALFRAQLLPHETVVIKSVFENNDLETPDHYNKDEYTTYAIQNGLASILYFYSKTTAASNISSQLQKAYFSNLIQSSQVDQTIQWIRTTLDQHQIKYLFLKGSLLAFTSYPDPSWRPMSDIDLLIEPDGAMQAYQLLIDAGAQSQTYHPKLTDNDHHLPGISYNNITIEVHQSLFPLNAKYNIDVHLLFRDAILWHKNNYHLPGPSLPHTAFYVATHLYYTYQRGGLRLSWLYDLKTLANQLEEKEDVNHLRQLAINLHLETPITFAGLVYYCLTGEQLKGWPTFGSQLANSTEVKRIVKSFRAGTEQKTSESYGLIIEQIREAKGLRNKYQIALNRMTNKGQLKGFALLQHFIQVTYRLAGFIVNRIMKALRLR